MRKADDNEPFAALAFKIMTDPHVGHLTYIRVYSGRVKTGDQVLQREPRQRKERIGRLLQMHANKREEIDEVFAGDIAAVVGLKAISTGETLCSVQHPILLESLEFPEPVISIAIEPKTNADMDRLSGSLERLAQEDPSFRVHVDPETGQTIISGMGELHLEIIVDRLLREFKVEANVGRPQVAYKETITTRPSGPRAATSSRPAAPGDYGVVVLEVEPGRAGLGLRVRERDQGGADPEGVHPAGASRAARRRRRAAPLAGYPVVDVKVRLARRPVPRRRLVGALVQDRGLDRHEGRAAQREAGAARADHGRRGRDARGVRGRRAGGSERAAAARSRASTRAATRR